MNHGKKLILLVDDNEEMLILAQHYLESEGFPVISARSGFEALKLLMNGLEPGLVLLDLLMPDIDGTTFLDHFEAILPKLFARTPIIANTELTHVSDHRFVSVLKKPFHSLDMRMAVLAASERAERSAVNFSSY